jgi:hypothetical protein
MFSVRTPIKLPKQTNARDMPYTAPFIHPRTATSYLHRRPVASYEVVVLVAVVLLLVLLLLLPDTAAAVPGPPGSLFAALDPAAGCTALLPNLLLVTHEMLLPL